MADDDTIVAIARGWREQRDQMVRDNQVSSTLTTSPGVSQRTFLDAYEAFSLRMMKALPPMDPETFEGFRELVSNIPSILQRRRDRG